MPSPQPPNAPAPKRSWPLMLLLATAGVFMLISVWSLVRRTGDDSELTGPFSVAERFISRLKHGEDTFPERDARERMGYAAAHELLSDAAREHLSFEDFYQLFLMRQNDHGLILNSRLTGKGVQRGGRDAWVEYQLSFGREEQRAGSLHQETLRLGLARVQGVWCVSECAFVSAGTEGR
ncbi:MAG: hypothetical protein EXS14_07555 [Planctomycetes bacterium]|nr:hypothetical protein [Planctomycetota bacterium]